MIIIYIIYININRRRIPTYTPNYLRLLICISFAACLHNAKSIRRVRDFCVEMTRWEYYHRGLVADSGCDKTITKSRNFPRRTYHQHPLTAPQTDLRDVLTYVGGTLSMMSNHVRLSQLTSYANLYLPEMPICVSLPEQVKWLVKAWWDSQMSRFLCQCSVWP